MNGSEDEVSGLEVVKPFHPVNRASSMWDFLHPNKTTLPVENLWISRYLDVSKYEVSGLEGAKKTIHDDTPYSIKPSSLNSSEDQAP